MSGKASLTGEFIRNLLSTRSVDELEAQLTPSLENPPPRFPSGGGTTEAALDRRWNYPVLKESGAREPLRSREDPALYARNIENLIGAISLPVGVAGPLRVNGLFAKGDEIRGSAEIRAENHDNRFLTATYGEPLTRQFPRSARFGVRITF